MHQDLAASGSETGIPIRHDVRVVASLMLLLAAAVMVTLQGIWTPYSGLVGLYVPDALGYRPVFEDVALQEEPLSVFQYGFALGMLIYYPFWKIHPATMVIPNVLMLLTAVITARKVCGTLGRAAALYACIFVALNPYFLIGITGPNKEIALTALVMLLLALTPSWKTMPLIGLLLAGITLVRPAFGAFITPWMAVQFVWRGRPHPPNWMLFFGPFFAVLGLAFMMTELEIPFIRTHLSTASYVEEQAGGSFAIRAGIEALDQPLLAIPIFLYRVVANGYSLIARPVIMTTNAELSLLGVGYFAYGLILAIALSGALVTLLGRGTLPERARYLAGFTVYVWLSVSVGLFVQPRYLMPVVPGALMVLGSLGKMTRVAIALSVLVAATVAPVLVQLSGISALSYKELPFRPDFFLDIF